MHPDKGGEQEQFQELQHAYEILSDEKKRKIYDQYGEEGLKEGRDGSEGMDIFDLLHGRSGGKQKRKTKSVQHNLKVTLEDVFKGNKKYLEISRYRICLGCKGSGSKVSGANTTCQGCKGQGAKMVVRQISMGYIQQQIECPDCNGEGTTIKEKDKCTLCKGQKVTQQSKMLEIDIDKGASDGKKYVFAGESDEVPDVDPGDVIVELYVEKHKRFYRKGADLVYNADISLLEALTGFELVIEHLDKREILIKNPAGKIIKPNVLKTVQDCGMPFFDRPYKCGNLYINFNIIFPDKLDGDQKASLSNLFPQLIQPEIKEKCDETYTLRDYDANDENTNFSGGKSKNKKDDEDDDEENINGRKVKCANQ